MVGWDVLEELHENSSKECALPNVSLAAVDVKLKKAAEDLALASNGDVVKEIHSCLSAAKIDMDKLRRQIVVLEQAARRSQNAEIAAEVAHTAGVMAVATSKLEVLVARNQNLGSPADDATALLQKATQALAYATSFEQSLAHNSDKAMAGKFLEAAQTAVHDVQRARKVCAPCYGGF